jgi:hypothetical protein
MATFQEAYDAVAERYADKLWTSMDATEISRAIYNEMRRMDAKDAIATVTAPAKPLSQRRLKLMTTPRTQSKPRAHY